MCGERIHSSVYAVALETRKVLVHDSLYTPAKTK